MKNYTSFLAIVCVAFAVSCGVRGAEKDSGCTGPDCQQTPPSRPVCGDGVLDSATELCDDGPFNGIVCDPVYDDVCYYCSDACVPEVVFGAQCGDRSCDLGEENCDSCPVDCGNCEDPVVCGDQECTEGEEDCNSCAADCGQCPDPCGDGQCDSETECCNTCPEDCGQCDPCGDGQCADDETFESCPADCPNPCGNGTCDEGETYESCSADCEPPVVCGDGTCTEGEETCSSCAEDCGVCPPVCGDGTCEWDRGENHTNCSSDCCAPGPMRTDGCMLYFNTVDYLSGPATVQVVGDCFGSGDWNSGPLATDSDGDGWAELNWCTVFSGDITSCRFSYRDPATSMPGWAQYGGPHLAPMCASDRAHVFCEMEGSYESCKLREGFYPFGEYEGDSPFTVPLGNQ